MDELHAIIEDPLSEENRNKRISVEESNQRVRKWLNANTPYFGRPEGDTELNANDTKHVNIKDGRLSQTDSMKVLDVKTEVVDQGDGVKPNVPPTVGAVGYPSPRHGLVASLPHGATFVPGFIHANPRHITGQVKHDYAAPPVASSTSVQNTIKHSSGNKVSFHIENLFSASSPSLQPTKSVAGINSLQMATVSRDSPVPVCQIPSHTVTNLMNKDQFSMSKTDKRKEAKLINAIATSVSQKDALRNPVLNAGIPALRVSPSVSQFGSIGMLHTQKHGTSLPGKSRRTPAGESPSSYGSSMSPQAPSVRTNLSTSKTEQQSPCASPQNLPKGTEAYQKVVKQGSSVAYSMDLSRPPLSLPMPLSNMLRPPDTANRFQLQQQQHFAETIRNRYVENQRLAAFNSFRPPHMGAASPPFKQGKHIKLPLFPYLIT